MDDLQHDKLTEEYTLRIPEVTKNYIDKLSPTFRKRMNNEILKTMARVVHESKLDYSQYLSSE